MKKKGNEIKWFSRLLWTSYILTFLYIYIFVDCSIEKKIGGTIIFASVCLIAQGLFIRAETTDKENKNG